MKAEREKQAEDTGQIRLLNKQAKTEYSTPQNIVHLRPTPQNIANLRQYSTPQTNSQVLPR